MCSRPKHTETRLPGKDGTRWYKYTHPLATHLSMSRGWTCRLKSQFHELHRPIYDFKIPMIEVFCQLHGSFCIFLHWLLTRGLMIESTGLKQWNTLGHRVVTEFSALNFHQIDHRFSQLLTPCQEPRSRPGCNHTKVTKRCAECGLKISESCASLLRNKMLRVGLWKAYCNWRQSLCGALLFSSWCQGSSCSCRSLENCTTSKASREIPPLTNLTLEQQKGLAANTAELSMGRLCHSICRVLRSYAI